MYFLGFYPNHSLPLSAMISKGCPISKRNISISLPCNSDLRGNFKIRGSEKKGIKSQLQISEQDTVTAEPNTSLY